MVKRKTRRTRCRGCKKLFGSGTVQNGYCGRCRRVSTTRVASEPTLSVSAGGNLDTSPAPVQESARAFTFGCTGACTPPPGSTGCHCTSCHETFGTVGAFDDHRSNGKCVRVPGLVKRRGFWASKEDHAAREAFSARVNQ